MSEPRSTTDVDEQATPSGQDVATRAGLVAGLLLDERYALDHRLDEDALGSVWEAFDRGLGRSVRLRVVALGGDDPAGRLRLALTAARTAIRLHHPGAIHVYDAFLERDRLVVVSELVDGPALPAAVARKPLREKRVAAIGFDILEPLAAAHAIGLVHGAIDPWCVLLPDKARPLLTGFGLAPPFTEAADLVTIETLGTLACVAPEQLALTGSTPASDLWSLGATLYYAVAGKHAFSTPEEITTGSPSPASGAPALWPVLEHLLAKDPEHRPSLDNLRRDLAAIAGIPLDDEGRPVVREPKKRRRDRRKAEVIPEVTADVDPEEAPAVAEEEPAPTPPGREPDWDAVVSADTATADPWVDWSPDGETDADGVTVATEPVAANADATDTADTADTAEAELAAEEERQYRATPSWPPAKPKRPLHVILLCGWVMVVMLGLLVTNGHFFRPKPRADEPSQARPELTTDPASVPADWIAYRYPSVDFGISHPPGFRVREEGPHLQIADPAGPSELRVNATTPPLKDPHVGALEAERNFFQRHPNDYRRLQMSPATYKGHAASLWEYTYSDRGVLMHGAELGFTTKKGSFTVLFITPDAQWESMVPTFRAYLSSVQPPK